MRPFGRTRESERVNRLYSSSCVECHRNRLRRVTARAPPPPCVNTSKFNCAWRTFDFNDLDLVLGY